jgi:hypothetical protein
VVLFPILSEVVKVFRMDEEDVDDAEEEEEEEDPFG